MDPQHAPVVATAQPLAVRTIHSMIADAARVAAVIASVMKEGRHYGSIPGTGKVKVRKPDPRSPGKTIEVEEPRKTILKPGVEALAAAFHLALEPIVEDLSVRPSEEDPIGVLRYRVKVVVTHAPTGIVIGYGIGAGSSAEEKYRWKRTYIDEEFEEYKARGLAREKWMKGERSNYKIKQIRQEPYDLENTILKMATKRARADAILTCTGASDHFTQDAEDMSPELRAEIYGDDAPPAPATPSGPKEKEGAPPAGASSTPSGSVPPGPVDADADKPLTEAQVKLIRAKLENKGKTVPDFCARFKVTRIEDLKRKQINDAIAVTEE